MGRYFLSVFRNLIMVLYKYRITFVLLTQHYKIQMKNEPENNNNICQTIWKVFDERITEAM